MKKVIFNERIHVAGQRFGQLTITDHEGKYFEVVIQIGLVGMRRFFFGIPKTDAA